MTWSEENNKIGLNYLTSLFKRCEKNTEYLFSIELYITAVCNQKCEYCYLIKNGNKLYPEELRDPNLILDNMDKLLKCIAKNYPKVKMFELFSGEIWHLPLGLDVLQKLLDFCRLKETEVTFISLPTNFTFFSYPDITKKIEYYIEEFSKCGVRLNLSCSNDGQILEKLNRPNLAELDKSSDQYYERLFNFCIKYGFGFHPMVNSHNIELWPEQFKWWVDQCIKYNLELNKWVMFLEVRNDEWTIDKIHSYLQYLESSINYLQKSLFNNDNELARYMLGIDTKNKQVKNYSFCELGITGLSENCKLTKRICIRLGDLQWVPCHRLSYDILNYGQLEITDNYDLNLQVKNAPLLMTIYNLNYKGRMKCSSCPIAPYCGRGCEGAQFETSKELFFPCESVCDFHMARTIYLYTKLTSLKITDKELLDCLKFIEAACIKKINSQEIEKWMKLIKPLMMN